MKPPETSVRGPLNRIDWYFFAGYWLLALPIIYFFNLRSYESGTVLSGLLFTFIIDSAAVLAVLYSLPQLIVRKQYFYALLIVLMLILLGLLYMMVYGQLYRGGFQITLTTWIGGILQHGRSYTVLMLVTTVRKVIEIKVQLEQSETEKANAERQKAETELQLIKTQVNPHFLFNVLNTLYEKMEVIAPHVSDMVKKLSDMLSYTLYDSGKNWVCLQEELDFLHNYVTLQRFRFGNIVHFDTFLPNSYTRLCIAPGILIQFLENAFKHGKRGKEARVEVTFKLKDNLLFFAVENPVDHESNKDTGGLGLRNARKALDSQYNNRYSLMTRCLNTIFSVHLMIKLHEQELP